MAKSVIVIDDHPITKKIIGQTKLNKKDYFIGDSGHAACGYTWKFFFPTKKVIPFVQIIDSTDAKLYLSFLGNLRAFETYVKYRIIHNPLLKWNDMRSFDKIDRILFEFCQKSLDALRIWDLANQTGIPGNAPDLPLSPM